MAESKPQDKPSATGNSFEMKPSSLSAVAGAVSNESAPESATSVSSQSATIAEGSSKSGNVEPPSEGAASAGEAPPKPKKKSVTFHSTLETTDENVVKKVYNPTIQPLTPIIKRECLAHPIRLTKSYNRKMKKRKQRLAMLAAASKPECIVRPSRLTEVILKSSKLDDATPSQPTSLVQPSAFSASDPLTTSSSESPDSTGLATSAVDERNLESGGTQFGDKRFILPKRSAHSSRVIKPNKRFLDEFELEIKKKNKNLAAAQAAAAAAGITVGSAAANSNNGSAMGDGFGDKLVKSDVTSSKSDDGIASNKKDGESGEGEECKKKKEKNKKDSEEQNKRIGKLGDKDASSETADGTSEPTLPTRSASSISINNPFAKTSLLDGVCGTSSSSATSGGPVTALKLMKPSVLLTAVTASTSSSLASATSIFGKSILRQPRLQFTTSLLNSNPLASATGDGGPSSSAPERVTVSEGPFSLHLKAGAELDSSKIFSSALTSEATTPAPAVSVGTSCSICGIVDSGRHHQPGTEKHGIGCHTCRKFISMIKKRTKGPNPCGMLKCKNDSKCSVKVMVRPSHVRSNHIFKERCHVCWVRRCLSGFPLPPSLKATLTQILPPVHRQADSTVPASSTSSKKESMENNIFSNSLTSGHPTVAASRILWNTSAEKSEFPKTSSFPSLSNPLAQNNSTFGSLPPIKLNISDKPLILAPSSLASPKAAKSPVLAAKEDTVATPIMENNKEEPEPVANTTNPEVTTKVLRPRSKVEPATPTPTSTSVSSVSTPSSAVITTSATVSTTITTTTATAPTVAPTTTTSSAPPSAAGPNDKRQRIDLKGPRVKHVCRSASIVLGQPLAMFPDDEDATAAADIALENIETPPSDSAADGADKLLAEPQLQPIDTQKPSEELQSPCADCKEEPPTLTLSPPATPVVDADTSGSTEKDLVIDEDRVSELSTPTKEVEPPKLDPEPPVEVTPVAVVPAVVVKVEVDVKEKIEVVRRIEEIDRPATRKATSAIRPQVLKQNINAITKSFNTNVRAANSGQQVAPEVPSAPLISIDFWENYDPAEVSRTGFGLILSEEVPLKALCFLCGSSGLDEMLFCVCCCEPYHQYCVKDEYNIRHASLDETNMSLLELTSTTMVNNSPAQQALNRFNWMCPRCTVCYTCNMATGTKVKCQKCCKNYHTTCLGTSKRLLGADRPMICAACLKCKSCSTTNVTKFIGNLPMCTPCFRLRQKGNFCPLCQRCYEENDFDLKMMECGDCQRWVHAKCEGLTDEQYNMLSALPENIEFICKKCGKNNESANVWRDAVAAEFKAGLLSVVKLLSKSRQACALLKLSPRKKTSNCTCLVTSGKSISFFSYGSSKEEPSVASKKPKLDEDSIYDFNSESSSSSTSFPPATKCYCSLKPVKSSDISLVEIKQKINANEYYSLQDFNYDMNTLVNSIGSEELSTAYKEFLSETFPWFQNETKACTDALEEAMCGEEMGGDYGLVPSGDVHLEQDQKVPSIDIPLDEIDDYFYESAEVKDNRICMLCKQQGEGLPLHESRLLYCGQNNWTHTNCALWSAEVFEEIDGSLQNVHSAAARGRLIKCCHCGVKGATVGCNVKNCGEHYHFPCARQINCTFMQDKTVYCPQHATDATRKKCPVEKSFEINRSVYVELDRRKKKFVEPGKVQFMMGSLSVKKLGHIVPMFSDHPDTIIPTDFECTRLYWSSKEPWKIVEYRIKTTIQNNNYCHGTDAGKNFTVDHTMSSSSVHWGLTQINRWHNSLNIDEQDMVEPTPSTSGLQKEQKTMKQLLEAVCGPSDDTNDEEPQNNNDLLPQEIKDAIFEDIPHDILDGISMLDILPKLMTYDDLIAMDLKNENNFNAEILKEVNVGVSSSSSSNTTTSNSSNATSGTHEMDVDEDDINEAIMKCSGSELSNDGWMKTISAPGIEDALLSAIKQPSTSRDLKRSKSVVRVAGQRSGSFSWNSKLESAAAKRRKMSKLADVLSLGRMKEDTSGNVGERRKSLPNEEFSWSANKKSSSGESLNDGMNVFEKLKISQLDGMDDFCGDVGEMKIYSSNMMEAPVKCDRCHATYRNQESYQRHLNSCEVLSTSESDSETRSPRLLSPEQQQAQVATQLGAGTFILPQTSVAQTISTDMYGQINQNHNGNPTISVISGLNNQTINLNNLGNQAILSNIPASMPITINQLSSGIPIQATAGTHQLPLQGALSNLGGNMIISNQGQIFAQPVNFQQTLDNQQGFVQNKQRFQSSQLPQTISLANNLMNAGNSIQVLQQQQPQQQQQIISIGANGQPQIVTVTNPNQPQHQQIIQNHSQKKQLIFPSMSPKKPVMSKLGQSPTPIKAKRSPPSATVTNSNKTIHMKKQEPIAIQQAPTYQTIHPQHQQQQQQQQQIQLINTSYPLIRPASAATPQQATTATAGNQIIFQQPNQPIIVQQVGGNQISYVTDQNQVQYLAPTNVLTQNGFTLNTSGDGTLSTAGNNILIPNGTGGYSMIPASALQLATAPQPQVIGTIIQPQATSIQCGMMSTEQMVLGATAATPTLEMVTDPTSGCMYLTSPSVYYGLETIVQNTVMSSQQFVSTAAMQGVLSQNSSFSATTTQVFQASKIEPIVEVPTGYVVLNNDGTTSQLQTPTGIIQQAQIQPAPTPTPAPVVSQAMQTWKIEPQTTFVQQQQQPTVVNPLKSAAGTGSIKNIIPKTQTQLVNKVMPNTMIKTNPEPTINTSMMTQKVSFANASAVYTNTAAVTTTTKVSNVIKPITKTTTVNKPKIVAKPVKQQRQSLLSPQPQLQHQVQQQIAQVPVSQPQLVSIKPSINSSEKSLLQPIVNAAIHKLNNGLLKNSMEFIPTQQTKPTSLLKKPDAKNFPQRNNSNYAFQASQAQQQQPQSIQISAIPTSYSQILTPTPTAVKTTTQSQPQKSLLIEKKPSQITMSIAASTSNASSIPSMPPTMSNSSITITPTQTASITLPTAPYPMQPLYSNIPTNVVNPIPQSNSSNSISNTTPAQTNRPTNRVLPMQASMVLPKSPEVPQTPPPLKLLNGSMPCDKIDEISIIPSHTAFSPQPSPPTSVKEDILKASPRMEIEIKPIDPIDIIPMLPSEPNHQSIEEQFGALEPAPQPSFQLSLNIDHHGSIIPITATTTMATPTHSLLPPNIAEIEIKPIESDAAIEDDVPIDMVKSSMFGDAEDMIAKSMQQDSMDGASSVDSRSMNDESESPEIQNKISEILDNLEAQTNEEEEFSECRDSDSSELLLKIEEEPALGASSPIKSQEEQKLVEELNQELQASTHSSPASSIHHSELIIPSIFDSDSKKDCDSGYNVDHKENVDPIASLANPAPITTSIMLNEPQQQAEVLVKMKSCNQQRPKSPRSNSPKLLYEIQSQDGFTYKSTSIAEIWDKLFEAVQIARKAHGLQPLPEGQLEEMAGVQMLGLKTNAIRYLLEQLPGVEKCTQYQPQYHKKPMVDITAAVMGGSSSASLYADYFDDIRENPYGAARCEPYSARSEYDMFSWLASRHRKQPPMPVVAQTVDDTIIPRRGSGSNLPMAMRYRTLKETSKESVGVYRSHIHGRGLFCNRDIEAGEMVIEYAGELIRSTLTDKRERYYDGRGIGCYMFKIDENFVVDATMRGNAARFINHSCEPNCYSKVVDILGHKHIIIFALRRIVQGEELTYDYKFPFEDVKIPCSCGSKKCRKYLN